MVQGVDTPLRRQSKIFIKAYTKNLAYGRHGISQRVRIVAQIQQQQKLSHVTCHMALTPTATATDTPPAISLTMHNRVVFLVKKRKQVIETAKTQTYRCLPISAIRSVTRGL